jgi:hypothetical protein
MNETTQENNYLVPTSIEPNIITINNTATTEVLRIDPEGRIFWKQREVETDDEFRAAMLELRNALMTR